MAFKEYHYGAFKEKITALLRRRLTLKEKIRYHSRKAKQFEEQLPEIEKQLNEFLKRAGN